LASDGLVQADLVAKQAGQMSGPSAKLVRRMISRTVQSVFAPTLCAWPAAAQAPAVDRVVRLDVVARFKPQAGVLGVPVDSNSVPKSVL